MSRPVLIASKLRKALLPQFEAIRIMVFLGCLVVQCGSPPLFGKNSGMGYLEMKVVPETTAVFVDGWYLGPASNFGSDSRVKLRAGEHEVTLSHPNSEGPLVIKVYIEAGKTTSISRVLQPVETVKPPFSTLMALGRQKFPRVFVNHQYAGYIGEFANTSQGLLWQPGEYTVTVILPMNGKWYERNLKIEAGRTAMVQANLKDDARSMIFRMKRLLA